MALRCIYATLGRNGLSIVTMSSSRGSTIFILGDLGWDQLQLLISKSTTADLLKMYHKLEEFFTQQFKSSRLVFSSLQTNKPKQSIRVKDRSAQVNKRIASGKFSNISSCVSSTIFFALLQEFFVLKYHVVLSLLLWLVCLSTMHRIQLKPSSKIDINA